MSFEPIRLLEQADASDAERVVLLAGRSCAPVDYDVAAGEARFRANLAALAAASVATGAVGAAGAPGTMTGAKALFAKLGVKIFLGLLGSATMGVVAVRVVRAAHPVETHAVSAVSLPVTSPEPKVVPRAP